jgi:hypothetical protein
MQLDFLGGFRSRAIARSSRSDAGAGKDAGTRWPRAGICNAQASTVLVSYAGADPSKREKAERSEGPDTLVGRRVRRSSPALFCLGDDRVDVDSGHRPTTTGRLRRARLQANTQSIDCTQHEAHRGTRVPALDLDQPLTADANALGKRRLV